MKMHETKIVQTLMSSCNNAAELYLFSCFFYGVFFSVPFLANCSDRFGMTLMRSPRPVGLVYLNGILRALYHRIL